MEFLNNSNLMQKLKLFSLIYLITSVFTFGQSKRSSIHLLLGNPCNKTQINSNNNFLIIKEQYALSYNKSKNIPNWVSWHVDINDFGKIKRTNSFRPNSKLPIGWYKVRPNDYTGTEFDKGHLCPSADRTNIEKNNSATFLMTNIIPQAPHNNRGVWKEFEEYCRRVVKRDNELYIIAGGYGIGGTGTKGKSKKIRNNIVVPKQTWKVIIILPYGEDDLKRIDGNTRIIAIDVPNSESVEGKNWREYKITLAELEKRTGYNFYENISPNVKKILLTKIDKR